MAQIKLLNILIRFENVFCIYRNYYKQRKFARYLILIYIFLRILYCFATLYMYCEVMYHNINDGDYLNFYLFLGLHSLTILNSFVGTIGGVIFTNSFRSFYNHINLSYGYFKMNKDFNKYMMKLIVFCVFCGIGIIALTVLNCIKKMLWVDDNMNFYVVIGFTLTETTVQIAFVGEHVVFFALIMLINMTLNCLNKSIRDYQKSLHIKEAVLKSEYVDSKNLITKWVTIYQHLVACAKQLSICFGKQLLLSIIVAIIYKIVIIYQLTSDIVRSAEMKKFFTAKLITVLCSYVSTVLLIMIGGQMVHNQMVQLLRSLASLYNTMVTGPYEAETKRLKDLIRLMKNYPVEIKLVSNVLLGLYLLPLILTFAVNYIIILLQFTHII